MVLYGTREMEDRRQAYGLLALAVREAWGWESLPALERGEHGKPFFPSDPGHCFNLSHSASLALCGLDDRPLGVDIQAVKRYRPSLPRRVCSARELNWMGEGEDCWRRFTLLWTLKESVVKRSGEGLIRRLDGIEVPLPGDIPEGALLPSESLLEMDGLHFRLFAGPDWYASVCAEHLPPEEIRWIRGADCPLGERPPA